MIPDLSKPSAAAALHFAQEYGRAIMRRAGRTTPNAKDQQNLKAELARLLWHVPVWDGGFLHGSDSQRAEARERWGLSDHAERAALRMGAWPVEQITQERDAA